MISVLFRNGTQILGKHERFINALHCYSPDKGIRWSQLRTNVVPPLASISVIRTVVMWSMNQRKFLEFAFQFYCTARWLQREDIWFSEHRTAMWKPRAGWSMWKPRRAGWSIWKPRAGWSIVVSKYGDSWSNMIAHIALIKYVFELEFS